MHRLAIWCIRLATWLIAYGGPIDEEEDRFLSSGDREALRRIIDEAGIDAVQAFINDERRFRS